MSLEERCRRIIDEGDAAWTHLDHCRMALVSSGSTKDPELIQSAMEAVVAALARCQSSVQEVLDLRAAAKSGQLRADGTVLETEDQVAETHDEEAEAEEERGEVMLMDGCEHYIPGEQKCNCTMGRRYPCPACAGFGHFQGIHTGYYYECEICHHVWV